MLAEIPRFHRPSDTIQDAADDEAETGLRNASGIVRRVFRTENFRVWIRLVFFSWHVCSPSQEIQAAGLNHGSYFLRRMISVTQSFRATFKTSHFRNCMGKTE